MSKLKFETLLEAGVHFGHLKRKWNPAMAPYIFEEKKGIHIIDLNKTMVHLDQACAAMKQIALVFVLNLTLLLWLDNLA